MLSFMNSLIRARKTHYQNHSRLNATLERWWLKNNFISSIKTYHWNTAWTWTWPFILFVSHFLWIYIPFRVLGQYLRLQTVKDSCFSHPLSIFCVTQCAFTTTFRWIQSKWSHSVYIYIETNNPFSFRSRFDGLLEHHRWLCLKCKQSQNIKSDLFCFFLLSVYALFKHTHFTTPWIMFICRWRKQHHSTFTRQTQFCFRTFWHVCAEEWKKNVISLVDIPINGISTKNAFSLLILWFFLVIHLEHSEENFWTINSKIRSTENILGTKSTISDNITFC